MFAKRIIAMRAGLLLFVLGSACAQNQPAISLDLTAPKKDFSAGERILLRLSLINKSDKAVAYSEGLGYRIEVIDQNKVDVSDRRQGRRKLPPKGSFPLKNVLYTLAPGETRSIRFEWTPAEDFVMKGDYHVRACRWNEEVKNETCSNSVTITVSQ
jgi:hypothetical protein